MSTADEFQQCQVEVKELTTRPSNEDLLTLYATYKQATDGDVSGKRPGMLDIKGRAKHDAWAALSGQSTEDAQQGYINKVRELQN
jgi:acyl-CoA-binding protein